MRLREGNETVRRGENKEEDGQRWRSPIEEDGGEGSSKSAVPGGGFQRRCGQTVTPRRGAGGSVVLFDQCHSVEGKAKEACGSLGVETKKEKERGSGGRHGCATRRRRGRGVAQVMR
jgi:hypothetical protein